MKALSKTMRISQKDFYVRHLKIVNALLPVEMTNREIEILGGFISLKGDLVNEDRFNSFARKMVRDNLNIKKPQTITNFLRSMVSKGYISKTDDGKYEISKFLFPTNESSQEYSFKLVVNGKNAH